MQRGNAAAVLSSFASRLQQSATQQSERATQEHRHVTHTSSPASTSASPSAARRSETERVLHAQHSVLLAQRQQQEQQQQQQQQQHREGDAVRRAVTTQPPPTQHALQQQTSTSQSHSSAFAALTQAYASQTPLLSQWGGAASAADERTAAPSARSARVLPAFMRGEASSSPAKRTHALTADEGDGDGEQPHCVDAACASVTQLDATGAESLARQQAMASLVKNETQTSWRAADAGGKRTKGQQSIASYLPEGATRKTPAPPTAASPTAGSRARARVPRRRADRVHGAAERTPSPPSAGDRALTQSATSGMLRDEFGADNEFIVVPTGGLRMDDAHPRRNLDKWLSTHLPDILGRDATLSDEQRHVLNVVVVEGRSVFITGVAGTGKSAVLRLLIEALRACYGRSHVFVTASTGVAALQLGGTTVHSFAGAGLAKAPLTQLLQQMGGWAKKRWKSARVLIVDEVSMLDGEFLDKLDQIGRHVRGCEKPFGGVQLVFCGDFFQLPPVPDLVRLDAKTDAGGTMGNDGGSGAIVSRRRLAFDSAAWRVAINEAIMLTHVFRQADAAFVRLLDDVRHARNLEAVECALQPCLARGARVLRERAAAHSVAAASRAGSASAPSASPTPAIAALLAEFEAPASRAAAASSTADKKGLEALLRDAMPATKLFPHKESVKVENDRELAVLGGVSMTYRAHDVAKQSNYISYLSQSIADAELVLRRGAMVICLKNVDPDRGVVNGSRGIVVGFGKTQGLDEEAVGEDGALEPGVLTYVRSDQMWPIVLFANGTRKTLSAFGFNVECGEEWLARRSQVPLALAYAITVHKCQGMTLDKVEAGLSRSFDFGMVYVALSRVRTLDGLTLLSFCRDAVRTNQAVEAFYATLERKPAGVGQGGTQVAALTQAQVAQATQTQAQVAATPAHTQGVAHDADAWDDDEEIDPRFLY